MDNRSVVQEKLFAPDKCTACLRGSVVSPARPPRLVAVVNCKDENAVFVYSLNQDTPRNGEDLNLELTFPVNTQFKFNIVAQSSNPGNDLPVRFSNATSDLVLQLGQGPPLQHFVKILKEANQVYSQNAGFGLPASFSWIDKYTGLTTPTPFMLDVFDPFKEATKTDDSWKHTLLRQNDVGKNCPVVNDDPFALSSMSNALPKSNLIVTGDITKSSSMVDFDAQIRKESLPSYEPTENGSRDSGKVAMNLEKQLVDGKPTGGRENLVRLVMNSREEEYVDRKPFTVFCGTWNTNGQSASEPVDKWLAVDDKPPDIYALGFQELDLSKNAFIFNESAKEVEWFNAVKKGLHKGAKYIRLKLIRLVGMMLVVFIREEHKKRVYNLISDTVGTGIMGMMGNKGGVGVRFELYDTSICFVNSHLAAHVEEYERRNQDFRDINNKMNFGSKLTISDHDFVFWIGDLNYRLGNIEYDTCIKLVKEQQFNQLMNYDQLVRQISQKKVFLDYLEGKITFKPTYKYDPGTDTFDTSEKCRAPAYCDRVLYRGSNIQQLQYRSHHALKVSDHKPVSALFQAGVKKINRDKHLATYRDVMQKLDRLENDFLPQVALDVTEVRFDHVAFMEPHTHLLTVTNTGQVQVEFEFIKKLDENTFCKPWLNVEPYKGVIKVGGECTIQLEVYVNPKTAHTLNSGADRIEDILVLHLEGGKDLFVSVTGSYLPSCFGSSIEALVHTFKPIRDVTTELLIDLEHTSGSGFTPPSPDKPLDIPKELWLLVDKLQREGARVEDLFEQPGLHTEVQAIRDALDTGQNIIPGTVYSATYALFLMLESFPEPVVPFAFHTPALRICTNFTQCKQVLGKVPLSHRNVFKYLCAFFRFWLANIPQDLYRDSLEFLAKQFGNLFIRRPPDMAEPTLAEKRADEQNKASFVRHFLLNAYDE